MPHPRCTCGAVDGAPHDAETCVAAVCTCASPNNFHGPECRVAFEPNPGPQEDFFRHEANEVLYGGAAGGGKSQAAVALPLQWVHIPGFNCIVFRRTTQNLKDLLSKAQALYPRYRGKSRTTSGSVTWIFPSGAVVCFSHLQHEKSAGGYDGQEFQLVIFDELPHFTEKQYTNLMGRIRAPKFGAKAALPRYTRSTANPPEASNPQGLWVFRRFGAWLDPEYPTSALLPPRFAEDGKSKLPPAEAGQVLWFRKDDGSEEEHVVRPGTPESLSRTFIPARLADNPAIGEEYRANLRNLDPVRRAQLTNGDWLIRPEAGAYFRRGWFKYIKARPADDEILARVRRWDLASTEKTAQSPDPDWTRGVRMAKTKSGRIVVEDVVSLRGTPAAVKALIKATAILDGKRVHVRFAQDPGQAGKAQLADLSIMLSGWIVGGEPETGDKITRAEPYSAQVEAGNVDLVEGRWNESYVVELEGFPTGGHDDQVDCSSGGFNYISGDVDAARLRAAFGK